MHPKIPLPINLFGTQRPNSKGYDLTDAIHLRDLEQQLNQLSSQHYTARPQVADQTDYQGETRLVYNPANISQVVGEVKDATLDDVVAAFGRAEQAKAEWQQILPNERAEMLEKMADLMEANMPQLFDLAVREAGKTLNNAIAEVREAVDFCRYYAREVRLNPEGYQNPRGIMVAISPWNFPLAIFVGEVASALVAGNQVLAKPAEQTSLMAHYAVNLFHQAGVPNFALQCLPGSGKVIGTALVQDPRVNGVIFTGSTDTAKQINRHLQQNEQIVPLVAETGGQNAMVVDSSALGEQVVADVLNSAFDSAGQRCSALRVLYLQRDVADHILTMLRGAMAELKVGRPQQLNTDVGPVIDKIARQRLLDHIEKMKKVAKSYYQVPIEADIAQQGIFVAPTLLEIDHINQLKHEVFGPVLHVIRFDGDKLSQVLADINSSGFGLTSGLHSRIDETVERWLDSIHAGNLYVNRNTVGAVVGVQPFGGMGLSGTGPKAGGPLYLQRLVNRKQWRLDNLEGGTAVSLEALQQGLQAVLSGTALQNALSLANTLSAQSPLGKIYPMQGITGESNYLKLIARPMIAIGYGSLEEQIQALIAIVVCGSKAVVKKDAALAKHQQHFADYLTVVDDFNQLTQLSIMIVLDPLSVQEKQHYAERSGAILTFIDHLDLALSLLPLIHEKAISINTAAAGGNASLMSEMD